MNLPTRSHHEARNGFRKGSAGLRERCVNQTSFVFHFSFLRFAPACRVQNAMNKIACLFPQMRGLASTGVLLFLAMMLSLNSMANASIFRTGQRNSE